jgi:hypothetical protein
MDNEKKEKSGERNCHMSWLDEDKERLSRSIPPGFNGGIMPVIEEDSMIVSFNPM